MHRSTPAQHSCRVAVAAAGYGKTTALRSWYSTGGATWRRGLSAGGASTGAMAGAMSTAALVTAVTDEIRAGAGQVIVDDLPRLPVDTPRALAEALAGLPGAADVVLSSRWPLNPSTTAGPRADIGPAELALSLDQVADLLAGEYELTDIDLPERVHDITAGWPVLVHLTAATLRAGGVPDGPLLTAVAEPGGALVAYVAEEVLTALPAEAVRLVRHVGDLTPVSTGLCEALGLPRASESVALLLRTGLLTGAGCSPAVPGGPAPRLRIVPVVAEAVRLGRRRPATRTTAVTNTAAATTAVTNTAETRAATAAEWYDQHGHALAAARAYRDAGQPEQCARVLTAGGEPLLAAGQASAVAALVESLPRALRARRLRLLHGDALTSMGQRDAASRIFEAIAAEAGADAPDVGLAWRIGRIHYQRGDARAALEVYAGTSQRIGDARRRRELADHGDHGRPGDAGRPRRLAIGRARAHLLAGDLDAALACARHAVSLASAGEATDHGGEPLDDSGRLVGWPPRTSAWRCAWACRRRRRQRGALPRRAADRRAHRRRGAADPHLHQPHVPACCAPPATPTRWPPPGSPPGTRPRPAQPSLRAIATCNEADALAMLGRYDEAVRQLRAAISRYQRMGSRRVAGAQSGARRGLPPPRLAGAGAGRVRGGRPGRRGGRATPTCWCRRWPGWRWCCSVDDPKAAAAHAERAAPARRERDRRARAAGAGLGRAAPGRRAVAPAELAGEAARLARAQGDRAGAGRRAGAARRRAPRIRRERGRRCARPTRSGRRPARRSRRPAYSPSLGRLPGARPGRPATGAAGRRAAGRGGCAGRDRSGSDPARRPAVDPTGELPGDRPVPGPVVVQALGRFEVRVGGEPVPPSRWQSRKARDLLRILVARRGRPVPRDELCELLWPDDDAGHAPGTGCRCCSSIVRGVLDPAQGVPGRPLPRRRPGQHRAGHHAGRRRRRGLPRVRGARPPAGRQPATLAEARSLLMTVERRFHRPTRSRTSRTRTGAARCARRSARRT